jgi:hypothetical protein
MLPDSCFAIDELLLPWGSTLLDVMARTADRVWHRDEGGWPNLRGACQSAFGLAVTACNLRAPAPHKPVLHIDYTFVPAPSHLARADAVMHWLEPLTQLLGTPTETTPASQSPRPERGSLLFRAAWQRPGHHLSLLVYGALKPDSAGPTATLAVEWQDLVRAAQPFLAATEAQEALLAAAFNLEPSLLLAELLETQPNSTLPSETDPYSPKAQFQQARRALFHSGLYRTPASLQARLSAQQAALWLVAGYGDWALSTQRATVLLPGRRGPGPRIELVTTRPAKGGGYMSLHVGELVLYDRYASPTLGQLAAELERRAFATVVYSESFDC